MENFRWVEHAHMKRSFLLSYGPVPNLAYALLVVTNAFLKLLVFCLTLHFKILAYKNHNPLAC